MHNNYYFLRQLSQELSQRITGFTLVSCFSQNKDELIIEFNNGASSFFIKASLQPEFQCLSFPTSFHRARKNSVDLFNGILMKQVTGVRQFMNERSFAILLEDDMSLLFSMHGARANAIWFQATVVQDIFRNNFQADHQLKLEELDRPIDWSFEIFASSQSNLEGLYFTFGKPVWNYLSTHHFAELRLEAKWNLLKEVLQVLENPAFRIAETQGIFHFSLLPAESGGQSYESPIEAINEFFSLKISATAFQREKASMLSHVNGKVKQTESFLLKVRQKLIELDGDKHYSEWADLIMANLNDIRQGQEKVVVKNFYDNQNAVEIRLKKELSPQKNAEVFYRKAKNRVIELKNLRESIAGKETELQQLRVWQAAIQNASHMTELKSLSMVLMKQVPDKQTRPSLPYHEFEFKGFKIWVGRNALANDTLTLKYSFKDDLWLHAKDVAGSHVLLKHQAGKPFPKDVIEYAAGLAAHYSKRKNESLCPVAFTPKKNVRKRKGDPAGAVVVDREDVILVEPLKGF